MSWNVQRTAEGKNIAGEYEGAINAILHGRNGFEQTAMKATIPMVETLTKHTAHTPYMVTVSAYGHHDDAGIGTVVVNLAINQAPVVEPPAPVTE